MMIAGKTQLINKIIETNFLQLTNKTSQIIVEDRWHSIQIHKPEAVINTVKVYYERILLEIGKGIIWDKHCV